MALLNQLRTWYAGANPRTRKRLAPLVRMLPIRYRVGGQFVRLTDAITRSQIDATFARDEQLRCLRDLIAQANITEHYSTLFRDVYGTIPDPHAFTIEDLQALPILTKEQLREQADDFLAVPREQVDLVSTGGSSGTPLSLYVDKDRSVREFAFIHAFWNRVGFDIAKHKRAVFRGVYMDKVEDTPWEYEAALGELRLSPFHMGAENLRLYLQLIEQYQVDYLHGYPSALAILANFMLQQGWQLPASVQAILPTSEPTLPHQLALFGEAFAGRPVMTYYGMSEKVVIAGQVAEDPTVVEAEPLYGVTELVDNDGKLVTTPGQRGRIVGTGFINRNAPLIRYDTEDTAELVALPSEENHYRLRMRQIEARRGQEFVVGKKGELISMTALNIHSAAYQAMQAFQLYQDKEGEVTLRAIAAQGKGAADIEPFAEEVQQKVGTRLRMRLELVDELPNRSATGKRPFIDQRLDMEQYGG